jgi:hypothetical protein
MQQYIDNQHVTEDEIALMALADDMASAATTFNAHGYEIFLRAREAFQRTLHKTLVDYK